MRKTVLLSFFLILFCFCGVAANSSNPQVFQGSPCINPPHVVGNYPNTPFLFYIPTSGERPITWSAVHLPKGLKLNAETGIISGIVDKKGDYDVVLSAKNKLGSCSQKLTISIGDELLLTPPMGWNSWNTFGRELTGDLILEVADAMVENGMRDLGYSYINIDDYWQLKERGADGHIQINKEKFPNGIKPVADYLHARGLKLGIYSDASEYTCGGVCGSYGYEETDAKDFAEWGIDLLKYDYCGAPHGMQEAIERYTKMGEALRSTNRSIVYSICEWGEREPWRWAKKVGGHYWRTTGDIGDFWTRKVIGPGSGVLEILEKNALLSDYAGPGGWNDPDMLIVGIAGKCLWSDWEKQGCTDEQYRSHMSLWCMMASPLLSGNDIRNMTPVTLETLTNPEIIAINQDSLGKQAMRVLRHNYYDVWAKPLQDGSMAIACFNRSDKPSSVFLNDKIMPEFTTNTEVRDVWEHKDLGAFPKGMNVELEPFQCKVYVFKPGKSGKTVK